MKKTIKTLAVFIASCILFGVFAVNAFAVNVDGNDDIDAKWEVDTLTGEHLSVNEQKTEAVLTLENGDAFAASITMLIASYDGSGKLIAVAVKTEAGDISNTLNLTLPTGTEVVKSFVLDSETNIPVTEQMAIDLAD